MMLPDLDEANPTQEELDELRQSLVTDPSEIEEEPLPDIDPKYYADFKPDGMAAWEKGVSPFLRRKQIARSNRWKLPEEKEEEHHSGSIYYGDEESEKPPE